MCAFHGLVKSTFGIVILKFTQRFLFALAEYQSDLLQSLKQQQEEKCTALPLILTTQELQVLNRGRNSAAGVASGRRGARKNPGAYQDATALEALLGYLYITDIDRCTLFLQWIRNNIEEQHHWLGET